MRFAIYLMLSVFAALLPATTYGEEDCARALIRDNAQSFTTDRQQAAALQLMTFDDYQKIAQSQGGGGGVSYGPFGFNANYDQSNFDERRSAFLRLNTAQDSREAATSILTSALGDNAVKAYLGCLQNNVGGLFATIRGIFDETVVVVIGYGPGNNGGPPPEGEPQLTNSTHLSSASVDALNAVLKTGPDAWKTKVVREVTLRPDALDQEASFTITYGNSVSVVVPRLRQTLDQPRLSDAVLSGRRFVVDFEEDACQLVFRRLYGSGTGKWPNIECAQDWPFGYVGWYSNAQRTMHIDGSIRANRKGPNDPWVAIDWTGNLPPNPGTLNIFGWTLTFDNAGNVYWSSGDRVGSIVLKPK